MKLSYTQRMAAEIAAYTSLFSVLLSTLLFFFLDAPLEHDETVWAGFEQDLPALVQGQDGREISAEQVQLIYYAEADEQLRQAPLGFSAMGAHQRIYHGLQPGGQGYFLVYTSDQPVVHEPTDAHDFILNFIAAAISACFTLWLVLKMARRLAEPVLQLRRQVDQVTDTQHSIALLERDDELGELSRSLRDLVERLQQFIAREKDFTRFASHELRSPITILDGNLNLLRELLPKGQLEARVLRRMESANHRMATIVSNFLWLAREQSEREEIPLQLCDEDCFNSKIEQLRLGYSERDNQRLNSYWLSEGWSLRGSMLSLLLDNLIRNALRHSSHSVEVTAHRWGLEVSNQLDSDQLDNKGEFGLQIVERICQQNAWQLEICPGAKQFVVTVRLRSE